MSDTDVAEILKLSAEERLRLVEIIWASLVADPSSVPLRDAHRAVIDERLAVPFETTLLGLPVTVKGVDLTERDAIVANCTRGRLRQPIPILDLVLPSPSPAGAEWIEAYRYWSGGR